MTITHDIDMDLVWPGVRPFVCAVQGEAVSRALCFHLTHKGLAWSVPEGARAVVRFGKSDGTGGIYDTLSDGSPACAIAANTVTAILAPQVLTCPGRVQLQLELRLGEQVLSSFGIWVLVEADPSAGADPSEDYLNWMGATVEALEAYLRENPCPGTFTVHARNEQELRSLLAQGKAVLVTDSIALTGPLVINKNHTWLQFGPQGCLDIRGKDFPAIILASPGVDENGKAKKLAWVRMESPRIIGGWTVDSEEHSVGIRIEAMGWHNEINHAEIQSCEYGIQTSDAVFDYDSGQQNSFYELYITNCRYGIDDRCAGLQNVRFTGGRIENNKEWGVVSAACNLCFNGTMIQGNDLGEVKLVNVYSDLYKRPVKSGGIFTNCYFEHEVRYSEYDAEGNPVPESQIPDTVFQLGDETTGEGWFGHLSLVGCKIGHYANPVMRSYGRGAIIPGVAIEQNLQRIQVIGCTTNGKQFFDIPNFDNGCRLVMVGARQGNIDADNKRIPLERGVGEGVSLQYMDQQYTRLGMTQATAISGVDAPLDYAHMRQLYLEPYGYETDEKGDPILGEDEKYIPRPSYGNWVELTNSVLPPWLEENAGISRGSLHYTSRYVDGYISPGWFVRTGGRVQEVDEDGNPVMKDVDTAWGTLVTASAKGVQKRVHGRELLLEPEGSDYGSWLAFTHAQAKPWEYANAGVLRGSLHYCTADEKWYQRVEFRDALEDGSRVDGPDKWSILLNVRDVGVLGRYGAVWHKVMDKTYIEKKGYVNAYNDEKYFTHRYPVTAHKTYAIHGKGVRWQLAGYPLALFTQTAEQNDANIGTVLVDGSASDVETDYALTFTPETDGYIWIAAHTSYTPLTVQEVVTGEGELMGLVLKSSTPGSDQYFQITVNDAGTLTALPCTK